MLPGALLELDWEGGRISTEFKGIHKYHGNPTQVFTAIIGLTSMGGIFEASVPNLMDKSLNEFLPLSLLSELEVL